MWMASWRVVQCIGAGVPEQVRLQVLWQCLVSVYGAVVGALHACMCIGAVCRFRSFAACASVYSLIVVEWHVSRGCVWTVVL